MNRTKIYFEVLENGKIPEYSDSSFKCYAYEDGEIAPESAGMVNLGFKLQIPAEYFTYVFSKIFSTLAGVGDSDYRGIYNCIVHNKDKYPIKFKKNDYIGNISVIKIKLPTIEVK